MDFEKYNFKEISAGEKIISVVHRHWFDILQHFFIFFVLIVALIGGIITFPLFFSEPETEINGTMLLFVGSFFALLIWVYVFLIWIDYYFDVWVITSERIINIEQRGLFVRHVSELKLQNIQDVTTEVEGLIPTVLNYGDVHIQTAAEQERFLFRNVPDPYHIKGEIMRLQKKSFHHDTADVATGTVS